MNLIFSDVSGSGPNAVTPILGCYRLYVLLIIPVINAIEPLTLIVIAPFGLVFGHFLEWLKEVGASYCVESSGRSDVLQVPLTG